jgi:HlyD family secretion protein
LLLRARIGTTLLALAVIGGLIYGFLPRPVAVDAATVEVGPLAVTVEEEGKTRVRDRYVVYAPMAGYLRRIGLKVGDPVTAGEALAQLEPARATALEPRARAQADARLRASEAALAAAEENARAAAAESELARQEFARAESLRRSGFISAQALDRARAESDRARAAELAADHRVRVARYERDVARAALAETARLHAGGPAELLPVLAPVTGRVLKVVRESEGMVQAAEPLLEIGDPASLEIEVEVLSTHAVRIAPGTAVLLERWGGEAILRGAVRVVEPAGFTKISALGVEEQRVRVIVDFTSPPEQWRRLGDGYRVEARFIVWEDPDVLQIPASSLFRRNDGWAVFVIEDGRARLRAVEVGQRAGLRAQVLSGLKAGERLIAHPYDRIEDGVRVKPR